MKAEGCREWRERIGALVFGQLPEAERFATEAHLDGCPGCRAEAEALAPLASLLGRADPDRLAQAPAPPPRLGERIVDRIAAERRAERRRPRRVKLALAAAAVAAVGAVVAVLVHRRARTRAPVPRRSPSDRCHAASSRRPPSRPARGEARSASRCTASGPAPSARCGCAARAASGSPPGRFATSTTARANTSAPPWRLAMPPQLACEPAPGRMWRPYRPVPKPGCPVVDRQGGRLMPGGAARRVAALILPAGCGGDGDETASRPGARRARADKRLASARPNTSSTPPTRRSRPAPSRSGSRTTAAWTTTWRSRARRARRSWSRTSAPARTARSPSICRSPEVRYLLPGRQPPRPAAWRVRSPSRSGGSAEGVASACGGGGPTTRPGVAEAVTVTSDGSWMRP